MHLGIMVHCWVHLVWQFQFARDFKFYCESLCHCLRVECIQDQLEGSVWIEDLICQNEHAILKLTQIE